MDTYEHRIVYTNVISSLMLTLLQIIFFKAIAGELILTQVQILLSVTLVCSLSCQKTITHG